MTINENAPTSRTAKATATRMQKSEQRWANHLRGRGYAVVPRHRLEAMLKAVPTAGVADEAWIRGFQDGVLSVAEVSDVLAGQ